MLIGVVLASAALLALELLELRVFSYAIDPLLVYSAISVALLGLGAGSMAVTRRPVLAHGSTRAAMSACLAGFSLATLASNAVFARLSERVGFDAAGAVLFAALPTFALFAVPYALAGVLLSIVMVREVERAGRVYFANLAGSAVGCVALYPVLRPLGAPALLALLAAGTGWAAVALARGESRKVMGLALGSALAGSLAVPFAERIFDFRPDPGDLYGVAKAALEKAHPGRGAKAYEPVREFSVWDPVSRVEVYAFPGDFGLINGRAPVRLFAQDGGAGSMLVGVKGDESLSRGLFEGTVYGGAYLLRPEPPRALIIGLGGAPDVLCALHHRAGQITGVEINQTAIDAVRGPYAELLGSPYQRPNVQVVHRDGRGFVEREAERYDVIQMTGADTYSAGAQGAFMFSESYLYTVEAFRKYVRALAPGGVLSIIRFGLEPVRVVTTALEALRQMGAREPWRHVAVVSQGIWVNVLITREPMSDERGRELAQAVAATAPLERVRIPVYEALGFGLSGPLELLYAPGVERPNPYAALLVATRQGRQAEVLRAMELDFSPVTDDRPFFFQFLSPAHLGRELRSPEAIYYTRGIKAHLGFLAMITLVAAAAILLPLRGMSRPGGAGVALGYFGALGLAYLFVELPVLQKSALFLGHPTYSAAVTLLALLLSSGVGALLAGRMSWSPERLARLAAIAAAALAVASGPLLSWLFRALLPLPLSARVVALAVAVAPLGLCMGVPFPMGLRALASRGEGLIAWSLGVNAFAGVLASLLAVPLAMFWGFPAVLAAAAALYAGAALLARKLPGSA